MSINIIVNDILHKTKGNSFKELDRENMELEKIGKKKVLYLRHANCCKIGPDDWMETEWTVYDDGSVEKNNVF